jgi:hypothetical protein
MTGPELYGFIKNDPELNGIVQQGLINSVAMRRRGGRKPDLRRKATREFIRFWNSMDGIIFRRKLEQKLGPDLAVRMMRGGVFYDVLRELETREA